MSIFIPPRRNIELKNVETSEVETILYKNTKLGPRTWNTYRKTNYQ